MSTITFIWRESVHFSIHVSSIKGGISMLGELQESVVDICLTVRYLDRQRQNVWLDEQS